ncbi:hypothetical protein CC1G_15050 [Coprinopsis cinerea okayama7|uniref:Uncharacterized protein n=1 Tax=Coprinopsis cinerea (strain Okayama-7 / 130 / ATCC MYA-4618 / FGSC 9003) TaxID=240176 RepID=D6RP35_COPC7|nr:hypothetical protein CC1G_15050 [Coprinopsis cinerea okayama7\|eukprot:XP_002910716.1 hypothetical protein CC1G_15050 [Coprinopsis cinerea okayama7\
MIIFVQQVNETPCSTLEAEGDWTLSAQVLALCGLSGLHQSAVLLLWSNNWRWWVPFVNVVLQVAELIGVLIIYRGSFIVLMITLGFTLIIRDGHHLFTILTSCLRRRQSPPGPELQLDDDATILDSTATNNPTQQEGEEKEESRWHRLLGRSLWAQRTPWVSKDMTYYVSMPTHFIFTHRGESKKFIASRGLVAGLIFIISICVTVNSMLIEPIQETSAIPAKTLRGTAPALREGLKVKPPIWTVVAYVEEGNQSAYALEEALSVTPIWDDSSEYKPLCVFNDVLALGEKNSSVAYINSNIQAAVFTCPSRLPPVSGGYFAVSQFCGRDVHGVSRLAVNFTKSYTLSASPDFQIRVNFTALDASTGSPELNYARRKSVSILLGMTDNLEDIFEATRPIHIFPGVSLLGGIVMGVRRRIIDRFWAAFLMSRTRTYFFAKVNPIFSDPNTPPKPNMGSFRLFGQNDHTYWEFVVDQREKTVLAAFGVIGGILSVLFLLFLLLFGSNYMNVLQGTKPLSPSGIICRRDRQKALLEKYPALLEEGSLKGPADFLRDELIDVGELQKIKSQAAASTKPTVKPSNEDPGPSGASGSRETGSIVSSLGSP